ncbi:MAG TPA: hypothetical protein VN495_01910 [Candidatus Paceibacterota bacterium]|nr:hypothetical protein [Candidatus Paceibacterota bacterium]
MAEWEVQSAGRLDEMGQGKMSLRIELQPDGDIILCIDEDGVPVQDDAGNVAKVEFCSTAGGGGRSPHTRRALYTLYEAMRLDAREKPDGIPKYPVGLREAMARE